jgi:hypothetical protein
VETTFASSPHADTHTASASGTTTDFNFMRPLLRAAESRDRTKRRRGVEVKSV